MKNPKREKLLPCPFDGKRARLFDKRLSSVYTDSTALPYKVACCACHASTTWYRVAGTAVAHWNRRSK